MTGTTCSYCNFTSRHDEHNQLISHLFKSHSNEPNFHVYCSYPDCTRSFTKIKSLQKHRQRDHLDDRQRDRNNEIEPDDDQYEPPVVPVEPFDEQQARITLQRHAAKFLFAAKIEGKITQTALETVKQSSQILVTDYLETIQTMLQNKLRERDPTLEMDEDMKSLFDGHSLFEGLQTEYRQNDYWLKNFNLIVSITQLSICKTSFWL